MGEHLTTGTDESWKSFLLWLALCLGSSLEAQTFIANAKNCLIRLGVCTVEIDFCSWPMSVVISSDRQREKALLAFSQFTDILGNRVRNLWKGGVRNLLKIFSLSIWEHCFMNRDIGSFSDLEDIL